MRLGNVNTRLLSVVIAILPLFMLLILNPVQAANFTAGTADELKTAIDAANDEVAHPGMDMITITQSIAIPDTFDFNITSWIVIQGSDFTFNGVSKPSGLFSIQTGGKLQLNNLTISGFNAPLQNIAGELYIQNSILESNTAAVQNHGHVEFLNVNLGINQAESGGAFHNFPDATALIAGGQ
ncbi:MAG TPA: hypothetical protein VHL11_20755, partial [Phototrophicaceae bacterium]|nr:hypothetical protein [Phototrophicaceae bacterium]